jgi:hypothetical protein
MPTDVGPPGTEGPGSSTASDLSALAIRINHEHREGLSAVTMALEHARRAGERLTQVKAQVRHGGFQQWIRDHCEFSYRTAANYMEVFRQWPEIEGLRSSKVQRDAPLTLSSFLRKPARPKSGPGPVGDRPAVEAIDVVGPEALDRSPTGAASNRHSDRPGELVRADTGGPEAVPDRGAGGAASIVECLAGGDSTPPSGPERAPSPILVERDGDPDHPGASTSGAADARPADLAADAPTGVAIIGEGRDRAQDRPSLHGRGRVRARLEGLGNVQNFDADAAAWRLLRPIAQEFLACFPPDKADGLYASFVVTFVLARSPDEWDLCLGCGGAGRIMPGQVSCKSCDGAGYQITPR